MKNWLVGSLFLLLVGAAPARAEDLGEMLRSSGWDRMIGTWVDKDTKGQDLRISYAWKFEGKVLEASAKTRQMEAFSLVGVNGKTGEVFHVGVDNRGTGSLGKWSAEGDDAVLELKFVTGDGDEGAMRIRHHLQDDDTMLVTIEGDEEKTVTLVRSTDG